MDYEVGYVVVQRIYGLFGEIVEQWDCSEVFNTYDEAYDWYLSWNGLLDKDLEIEERYFGE